MRLPEYAPDPRLARRMIAAQRMGVVEDERVAQLRIALQPVLAYHDRSRMAIVVLRSDEPKAYLIDRAMIVITLRLMVLASEEEIRGIVAHELAHEYIWEELPRAREAKNWRRMREGELFCDAVAAFTLKEIGDDPASYRRILQRITIIGSATGSTTSRETGTHPSLFARRQFNRFLCRQFGAIERGDERAMAGRPF